MPYIMVIKALSWGGGRYGFKFSNLDMGGWKQGLPHPS